MEAVLNAAIGYQALHLPHPQDTLHHARQQVTKAWAQHGGWPTSFPKEAMMAHWRYYGDNTGALVDMAYAKHAAHLLHRVTHNHQPEVRKAAAICIKEAQMARNSAPGGYWGNTVSPPPWALASGPGYNSSYRTTRTPS